MAIFNESRAIIPEVGHWLDTAAAWKTWPPTGVELLELPASDSVLRAHPPGTDPIVLAQALGQARDIPAVFVGARDSSAANARRGDGAPGQRRCRRGDQGL